ncbi:paeninodin family lasso peptide [Cohnella sp. GbtcB17]|uniref:paeninodin family lasso peptide n=1 Tax=Cohnella sp. GbtcB17 TaxID=2824762 RepID=UPI001C2F3A5D|nr:paeninodin family lasso peptide [Cohnella sp. GbtcB17]
MSETIEGKARLPWQAPALETLTVKETMDEGGLWAFTPKDDFYQRSLLLDS